MTIFDRRPLPAWLAAAALMLVQFGVACGSATDQTNAPIRLELSRIWITLENASGEPLRNVLVQVVPFGESTVFSVPPTSLASGERRDIPLASFRGRDGTPLDMRVARIKSVRVTAATFQGKVVQVEVPWK